MTGVPVNRRLGPRYTHREDGVSTQGEVSHQHANERGLWRHLSS